MSFKNIELQPYYISGVDNLVKKFYIPVLEQSVLYQRRTGYFNSRALAMAGRGLTGLLKKNGKMQLICSVELDEPERKVLEDPVGFLERKSLDVAAMLEQPYDQLEKLRLGLLAELLARGRLEIKVAVPQSGGIYHEKAGIFHDDEGNIVAFNGSGNETPGGWLRNTESFHAYTSWGDPRHIKPEIRTFDALWNHQLPGTTVIPLPEAVKKQLIRFRDYYREGLDEPFDEGTPTEVEWSWTPELAFVFESPRLWNHTDFAYGEVAVKPYDHQDYVASSVLSSWPPRCMLCDEVGLGKTIEAGLIVRGYIAAGRADRVLILAPKNILKQWQLQLLTKFNILAWRLDGNYVLGPQPNPDIRPEQEKVDAENPFRTKPIMLVSSQLIRSERRRQQLLGLEYDLVVLDEAHHARARGASGRREPNLLLEALDDLKLQTQGLIFMTATPIQLSRKELWDLLMILELPGTWQDEERFDRFFREIDERRPDWRFLFEIVQESISAYSVDEHEIQQLSSSHPTVDVHRLLQMIKDNRFDSASKLDGDELKAMKVLLYRLTPVHKMVFRNSRELLRKYFEEGKYKERMPEREPQTPDKISLTGKPDDDRTELGLYLKIDKYVRDYYAKYEGVRKGLGFLMEVYRKRLTSSFFAITKSLERRAERIGNALEKGEYGSLLGELDEEDPEIPEEVADRYAQSIDEGTFAATPRERDQMQEVLREELAYLNEFLSHLQELHHDSKRDYLQKMLREKLTAGVRRIIIFSQFKDTVDSLLDYLRPIYGQKLGSYTGEGGSFWDGREWKKCSKQKIQEKFTDDSDELAVLICTDAASEGLDLQSCDTLINYDIPWNPMRIEQRIGRIDRIGQKSPKVTIHTLYYENTVEERVYARCLERIGYFKSTLGHLQPILLETERFIRQAALAKDQIETDKILKDMDARLDETTAQANENKRILEMLNYYEPRLKSEERLVPVRQEQLEKVLSPLMVRAGWTQDGEYWVKGESVYTFRPSVVDSKERTATLLTPLSNLSLLFGNLPSIPDRLPVGDGFQVHRLDLKGYIAYVTEKNGRFHVARRIEDVSSPKGPAFRSLEEAIQDLSHQIKEHHRRQLEAQERSWQNRKEGWVVRAHMYLDKVLLWRWRSVFGGGVQAYDEKALLEDWKTYTEDPDRKLLREVVRISGYRADPAKMAPKGRGRPPKTSPRSSLKEDQFLKELARIQERLGVIQSQLRS
jgi:ERCC4-related helicase